MIFAEVNRLASKVALFAILFVSLAPTISHALALDSTSGIQFFQQVCTSSGKSIVLNIKTTQGQQLDVAFAVENKLDTRSSVLTHISHCPLCKLDVGKITLPETDAVQALHPALSDLQLEKQPPTWSISVELANAHTTRAPPLAL